MWSYRGINDFGRGTDEGNLLALHPTIKPVALVADAILDASSRGEIVLDPFLGSGTTRIAAERTGRRCHGIEIDPVYVDTIIRRRQAFTGDTARHAATGQAFNEERGAKCTRNSEPNTASGTASRRPTVVSRKVGRAAPPTRPPAMLRMTLTFLGGLSDCRLLPQAQPTVRWGSVLRHPLPNTSLRDRVRTVKWVECSKLKLMTRIDGQRRERHGLFRCGAFRAARIRRPSIPYSRVVSSPPPEYPVA